MAAVLDFAFVSVDASGKPKSNDRKLIRSHCMRGKNMRIGVPRRLSTPTANSCSTQSILPLDDEQGNRHDARDEAWTAAGQITSSLSSSLALVEFAFSLDNGAKHLVFHWLSYYRETMYPIEFLIDFDSSQSEWFYWLFQDVAYLQCSFFMMSATTDMLMRTPTSPNTYSQLRKSISLLNQRLCSTYTSVALHDSTIAVVVMLTMFSCMLNDHAGARAHLSGLRQMVRLRGGLEAFKSNTKLSLKLGRVDLVYALNTGSDGVLCTRPVPYSPLYYNLSAPFSDYDTNIYYDPSKYGASDPRILTIFREMQNYSNLINHAHQTKQRRSESEYLAAIFSFQYRLLQLQDSVIDSLSECLRLAMLAFLVTTFQFPGTRARYPYLADQLKESCRVFHVKGCAELKALLRWVLVVGGISVFDVKAEAEVWMREKWRAGLDGSASWEDVRAQLRQIIWIDSLQDTEGRTVFEELSQKC
ncbi:hypothetical protein BJX99DRAFT_228184 [Aspergillus californicus]